jgi:hypothetical protein
MTASFVTAGVRAIGPKEVAVAEYYLRVGAALSADRKRPVAHEEKMWAAGGSGKRSFGDEIEEKERGVLRAPLDAEEPRRTGPSGAVRRSAIVEP